MRRVIAWVRGFAQRRALGAHLRRRLLASYLILLAVAIVSSWESGRHTAANTRHIARLQTQQLASQVGSCLRGDIKTVQENQEQLADYLVIKGLLGAERDRLSSSFVVLLTNSERAKAWVQPTDCHAAIELEGALYQAPPEIPFVTQLPPRSALTLPAAVGMPMVAGVLTGLTGPFGPTLGSG